MSADNFVQIGTAVMLTVTGEKKTEPLYTKADLLIQTHNNSGNAQEDSARGRRRLRGASAQQPPARAARAERGGVEDGGSKYYLPPCKSVNG